MNSSPFSPHKDVLEAPIPADAAGKERLLHELKNRAKAAVQASAWPDAASLYRKALECITTTTTSKEQQQQEQQQKEQAILQSNLSLVLGKMHQWDAAKEAAVHAVAADNTYVKAWWRLSQAEVGASKNYKKAMEAMQTALHLEPTNKALQKELSNLQSLAAKQEQEKENEKASVTETVTTTTTVEKVVSQASKAASTSSSTTSTSTEKMQVDEDGGGEFSKSEVVRGYKIVNGKKTSYFHNELSEDAKKLIGDIAPKKLDNSNNPNAALDSTVMTESTAVEGTSAWNKAGTWEERDVSTWAHESIQEKLLAVTYTLPASSPAAGAVVQTESVSVRGHASIAAVRGKKRYIYELSLTVHWKLLHQGMEARGKVEFPDVDATTAPGDAYEATHFTVLHADDESVRPVLDHFVYRQGYRERLHKAIDAWVELFKETY